jgi:hypothetical protein
MTINNLHKRCGTTDNEAPGLMPGVTVKVIPPKDFEGVIKGARHGESNSKMEEDFLEKYTYQQLSTLHDIVKNYKQVVRKVAD